MWIPIVIASRIVRQLTNDRRTIGMIIIVPLIITLVFGYAFQGETYHNPIVVINSDQGFGGNSLGNTIIGALKEDDRVNILYEPTTFAEGKNFVTNRTVEGAIYLPENLTASLIPSSGINASIIVFYDEAEPAIGGSILAALSDSLNKAFEALGQKLPITIDKEFAWGTEEIKGLDVSLPGIIGYIIMFLTILLTVLLSVREDLEGTKARFYSAPVNRWQIILGYLFGMTFFAILISIVVASASVLIFNATIRGSLALTFLFILYFAIGTVMLALFLARVARNEFQAVQMAVIVAIPSIALSGFMVPVTSLPDFIAFLSPFIPLTYAIEGLKTLMLRGGGIEQISTQILALTIYTILAFIGAVLASRETVA